MDDKNKRKKKYKNRITQHNGKIRKKNGTNLMRFSYDSEREYTVDLNFNFNTI